MPKSRTIKKSHVCAHCQREFDNLSNAKRHLMTHGSKKPFSCIICKKRFSQSSNCNTHIRTNHGGINPKGNLKRHFRFFSKQCHNCNGHFLLTNKEDKTKFCDTCFEKILESFYHNLDIDIEILLDCFHKDQIPLS